MKTENILHTEGVTNVTEILEATQEKADKWDKFTRTGVPDHLKDIANNIPLALVECSSLQQMIIESVNELDDTPANMCHICYATQRLMNIIHDIFYNKETYDELFS